MRQFDFATNIEERSPFTGNVYMVNRMTSDWAERHPLNVSQLIEDVYQEFAGTEFEESREALLKVWTATLSMPVRGDKSVYPNAGGARRPAAIKVWLLAGDYWRRGLRLGDVLPERRPSCKITRLEDGWIALFPKDMHLLDGRTEITEPTGPMEMALSFDEATKDESILPKIEIDDFDKDSNLELNLNLDAMESADGDDGGISVSAESAVPVREAEDAVVVTEEPVLTDEDTDGDRHQCDIVDITREASPHGVLDIAAEHTGTVPAVMSQMSQGGLSPACSVPSQREQERRAEQRRRRREQREAQRMSYVQRMEREAREAEQATREEECRKVFAMVGAVAVVAVMIYFFGLLGPAVFGLLAGGLLKG